MLLVMQAVPLPEAREVSDNPGALPEPSKVTKAYFEVSQNVPFWSSSTVKAL